MGIVKARNSKITSIIIFIFYISNAFSQIYINEFQAYNASSYLERWWGNFPDWIELYNAGDEPVNLSGYYITDDVSVPTMWKLPSETINPGDYQLLFADKVAYKSHTNFSLNGTGEQILLFTPELQLMDSVSFGSQYPDISYGRFPDGSQNWCFFEDCSPDKDNSPDNLLLPVFADKAQFSQAGGFHSGSLSITLSAFSPSAVIRYTLNGSDPDTESPVYIDPIDITSTTVVRVKVFEEGLFSSQTATQTYILNKEITLPVISISTDWRYLWDGRVGIHVVGDNGIVGNCSEVPVNYNQDWERPINIEYYDQNGNPGFNQIAGTKIFGACSRRAEQKSLSIFARGKYGKNEFDYKLFQEKDLDKFKSFIIRNSGNDIRHTMLRDGMMQTLVKDRMDVDYQEYQPAIIFLNGEYWGILNIREKINEDYLESNHGVDPDSVDILYKHIQVVEGEDTHFQNMMDYIRSNDLNDPVNYEYVGTQMDIDQFLNYYIAQIYYFNQDWPQGNIKYWRPQIPTGSWRWLLYDLDFGFDFLQYHDDMVEWATAGSEVSTELFRELLTNDKFYHKFLQRICSHMNTSFQPDRVIGIIDSLATNIEAEMPYHIDRFRWPRSMSNWYDEWNILRDFATDRLPVLTNNLKSRFGLEGTYELTTTVSEPQYGSIEICEVAVPASFSGQYFMDIPVSIKAIPKDGYTFNGWEGASSSGNNEIQLLLSSDASVTAHFGPAVPLNNIHINEVSSNRENAILDDFNQPTDWIEIYNSGTEPIQLGGLFLTDSLPALEKHIISFDNTGSTMVYPDSSIVLYADNEPVQGCLHLNFKLSNGGETLALAQRIGGALIILDSVSFTPQIAGTTRGRLPNGTGNWQMTLPTPRVLNSDFPMVNGLFINEFSASNESILADEYGEYDDWIEIYNDNDLAVDVGGLYLTDSLAEATKHRIPTTFPDSTTIPPKGYLLLWADNQPGQGILHLGFGIRRSGEQIGLVQYNGVDYIDSLTFSEQYTASSISRYPDGKVPWYHIPATPGSENINLPVSGLSINEFSSSNSLIISDEFGEYDDWIEIYNNNDQSVDVGGLFITDTLANTSRFRIPTTNPDSTTIPSKGFMVLWADNQPEQGILHLGFGLKRSGEQVGLIQFDGLTYIDSLTYEDQHMNASVSRFPDGAEPWYFLPPTPGGHNVFNTLSGLYFTEFSASNTSFLADDYGEFDDWIEIYNDNIMAVDVGGLFITDSLADGKHYRIPTTGSDTTTIPPKGYLIVWADKQPEQGVLHLDFGLSRGGEQIGLLQYNGIDFLDSLSYSQQFVNASSSRYMEDVDHWLSVPSSPGSTNYMGKVSGVFINEFSSSNLLQVSDNFGDYDDWIELYNDNDVPVDIGGLFLTDSLENNMKYRIPTTAPNSTTIPAKGYMIVWADKQIEQGILHLSFGLKRGGEQIGLLSYDGITFIDSMTYGEQYRNASQSRYPDGETDWLHLPSTPGVANVNQSVSGIYINEFSSSNRYIMKDNYGEYDDWIELYNGNSTPVDLGGLFITDSLADGMKFRIPTISPDSTTIPASGFMVLWADNQANQGVLHLDFGLKRKGEQIGLLQYNGIDFIDTLTYNEIMINTSLSRFPDGEYTWLAMNSTPGSSNIKNEYLRLYINEFRAGDPSENMTSNYQSGNWIELFNNNDYSLDIGGLYLTDSLPFPNKYRIPENDPEVTTIPPRGHLVLWSDNHEVLGPLHLNFVLEKNHTQIGLARKVLDRYEYIDTMVFSYQHLSVSTGRVKDGVNSWTNFTDPTPGWSNGYTVTTTHSMKVDELRVFPNPVTNGLLYFNHMRSVKLYDQLGTMIKVEIDVNQLDVSFLPSGLYYLMTEQGEVIRVLII